MENLVRRLKRDHPGLLFSSGIAHCWSPGQGRIFYASEEENHSVEGLLHELGHARLSHNGYLSDLDLLQKEVEAWEEALCLGELYSVELSQNHIQDCLDTYRDWIHKRSTCPVCKATGLQQDIQHYGCLNCGHAWRVTTSRFRRPYRFSKTV